jgi:hypothetical protein
VMRLKMTCSMISPGHEPACYGVSEMKRFTFDVCDDARVMRVVGLQSLFGWNGEPGRA